MADNTTGELSDRCDELSAALEEKYTIVADYESDHEHAVKLAIRARAAAIGRDKSGKGPLIVKMLIENDPQVIDASDKESETFQTLLRGNAEIKGLEAKFQSAKHQMQLKIQELRSLGGYGK